MFEFNRDEKAPDRVRASSLLPLVRAALTRGEGPPAVVAWVRSCGFAPRGGGWNSADEACAHSLAHRLADALARPRDLHTRAWEETQ